MRLAASGITIARLLDLTIAADRAAIRPGPQPSDASLALPAARAEAERATLALIAATAALAAEPAETADALAAKAAAVLALPGSLDDHAPLVRALAAACLRHLGRPVPESDAVEREAEVLAVAAEIADLSRRAADPPDLRAATSAVLRDARELNARLRRRSAALAALPAATGHGLAAKARAALSLDAATGDDLWFRALARSVLRDAVPLRLRASP